MKNKRGVILIFVLIILLTFSLLAVGLGFRARIANRLSYYFTDEHKNIYLVKRLVKQIMLEIIQDDNEYDGSGEQWAQDIFFELEDETTVKVFVEDEDRKLDLNKVSEDWLFNLSSLSVPLKEKIIQERPFLVIEEVLYLEDISAIFYPKKATIFSLVTTHNHDKININTIVPEVLYATPGLSQITADTILSLRENEPIENLEILKNLAGITVDEYQNLNKLFKTTSDFYTISIQINNEKKKIRKSFKIVLQKNLEENKIEIIRWLEE